MTTSNNNQKISLNDFSEYGMCFACGPKNSSGLQLLFKHRDKGVETSFEFNSKFQGFPNYMHGGIISTILDETMNRAALSQNYWVLTAQLNVKFKQPIITNQEIYAYGEIKRKIGTLIVIEAFIKLPNKSIAATAIGHFSIISNAKLKDMTRDYPELADQWMHYPDQPKT
tara:strand:- start:1595 stop:2104 length:510 start_codon:yes stop_codon:yes gene_type:complete